MTLLPPESEGIPWDTCAWCQGQRTTIQQYKEVLYRGVCPNCLGVGETMRLSKEVREAFTPHPWERGEA